MVHEIRWEWYTKFVGLSPPLSHLQLFAAKVQLPQASFVTRQARGLVVYTRQRDIDLTHGAASEGDAPPQANDQARLALQRAKEARIIAAPGTIRQGSPGPSQQVKADILQLAEGDGVNGISFLVELFDDRELVAQLQDGFGCRCLLEVARQRQ